MQRVEGGRGPIIPLTDANLSGADLSYTNLSRARGVTEEQLEGEAQTLEGATMPDGSKHP